MTDIIVVAVYGTLRAGLGNHHVLSRHDPVLLDTVTLPGFMMHDIGHFPGIVRHPSHLMGVVVELYGVTADALPGLDQLEGYKPDHLRLSLYIRETVETDYGPAYIYIWNLTTNNRPVIASGDWKKRRGA